MGGAVGAAGYVREGAPGCYNALASSSVDDKREVKELSSSPPQSPHIPGGSPLALSYVTPSPNAHLEPYNDAK